MRGSLVDALRNPGVDVVTASEANTLGYVDEEQLRWATEQRHVLSNFNVRDFCRLHSIFMAQERSHTGMILVTRQRYSMGEQFRASLKLIATKPAEEMTN